MELLIFLLACGLLLGLIYFVLLRHENKYDPKRPTKPLNVGGGVPDDSAGLHGTAVFAMGQPDVRSAWTEAPVSAAKRQAAPAKKVTAKKAPAKKAPAKKTVPARATKPRSPRR